MNRLAEIQARAAEIQTDLDALKALEEPTPEDLSRTKELLDERDALDTEAAPLIDVAQRLERASTALQYAGSTERAYDGIQVQVKKDPFEALEHISRGDIFTDAMRDRALSAFEGKENTRGMNSEERDTLMERIEKIPGAAEYALAHGTPEYRSAFQKILKAKGQLAVIDFTSDERAAMRAADDMRTALNITTGASGQFSLPTVFDPQLIHTGTAAINPIRQIARVVQGVQNVWNGVSVGNVTTYWHAEAAALTDGSPTLAHPIVTAGHLTAWVPASWEFFDDSSMVAQLPGLIGEAFGFAESTAFVSGSGTSQPKGIVTAISATVASTVTATTAGSFTSASSKDVFAVANALPSRYENTSSWIGNKATFNTIRQMSSAGYGSLFWGNLTNDITPNPAYPLLGYPTYNSSDVLSTTTTGTVLLVLGDFSQYLILDVLGTTIEFVQNVVNSSGIPTGQRGVVARKRVGANVTDVNAFRFLLAG